MSPDASDIDVPDDDDDTTGFAPAVEEGLRKDANGLVAFDAESDMAGASAPLCACRTDRPGEERERHVPGGRVSKQHKATHKLEGTSEWTQK